MIKLENLSKKYVVSHEKQALVRSLLPGLLNIRDSEEFWALRDINLELNSNKCLGVIGRNGCGKTTLLNVISKITTPTIGRVNVKGRVSTLLTLGAGFHSELTGEENIYLNASILGMTFEQIRNKFSTILDFSELKNFINAPLRTYSAGMQMRLGFAIAINADFDILLIDEVLSVGDIAFQQKCLNKMRQLRHKGKTIILVSQSLDLIEEFCDEVILLDNGKIVVRGEPLEIVNRYQKIMGIKAQRLETQGESIGKRFNDLDEDKVNKAPKYKEFDWDRSKDEQSTIVNLMQSGQGEKSGTKEAQILRVRFLDDKCKEKTIFNTGEKMQIEVDYLVEKEIYDPHFGIAIFRDNGIYCFGPNTRFDGVKIDKLKPGQGKFAIEYKSLNLLPGKYLVSVAIWERDEKFAYDHHFTCYSFEVESNKKDHGIYFLKHKWRIRLPK